ncbi:MAG: hypothetical protein ACLS7Z_02085 [Christensenellales bacterium]
MKPQPHRQSGEHGRASGRRFAADQLVRLYLLDGGMLTLGPFAACPLHKIPLGRGGGTATRKDEVQRRRCAPFRPYRLRQRIPKRDRHPATIRRVMALNRQSDPVRFGELDERYLVQLAAHYKPCRFEVRHSLCDS